MMAHELDRVATLDSTINEDGALLIQPERLK
jgi:hypothetical protein